MLWRLFVVIRTRFRQSNSSVKLTNRRYSTTASFACINSALVHLDSQIISCLVDWIFQSSFANLIDESIFSPPGRVAEAVAAALEAGYRHIDAAAYYHNEAEIGEGLHKSMNRLRLRREDVFITSKPGGADFPVDANGRPLTEIVSLIDTWKEMEKLVDEGLVKSIGVSNFNRRQIDLILNHCRIKPANLQVEIHANFPNTKLVDYAKSKGLTVTAYSPLGSPGAAAGEQNLLTEPRVVDLANKHKKTTAQILLRYLLQRGLIVIPKSITPERIKQNIQVFDFELSEADVQHLMAGSLNQRHLLLSAYVDHPEYPFKDEY